MYYVRVIHLYALLTGSEEHFNLPCKPYLQDPVLANCKKCGCFGNCYIILFVDLIVVSILMYILWSKYPFYRYIFIFREFVHQ